MVSNTTWRRVSLEFAGSVTAFGRDSVLRVLTLSRVCKSLAASEYLSLHIFTVLEPPGAKIRMFRFMRDVEPEDPMFLM